MSQDYAMNCTNCHGQMADVAKNPSPWLNEPRCDNAACHGPGYTLEMAPGQQSDPALYRLSRAHGGTYCAGCHDSPHAIAISREDKDAIKFQQLQGRPGTLRGCSVCHLTLPTDPVTGVVLPFRHRWMAPQP